MLRFKLTALSWAACLLTAQFAAAGGHGSYHGGYGGYHGPSHGHGGVFIGLGFYPSFGYGSYGGYYGGYPYGIAAPAVIVEPAPVIVQPAPVIVQPAPVLPAPSERLQRVPEPAALQAADVNAGQSLLKLNDPSERVRAEASLQLGRDKVRQAVPALTRVLNTDKSPQVRDAAARSLGLIGSSQALSALQNAALADEDRDVRHSAAFAADVIRAYLRNR